MLADPCYKIHTIFKIDMDIGSQNDDNWHQNQKRKSTTTTSLANIDHAMCDELN